MKKQKSNSNFNSNSDGDFKKQTEIENDDLSILVDEGFFHVPWMKYKISSLLIYLIY